ncbi:hypothetical protein Bca4012_056393 [Brassica carinata]|uniref:Uncharacterized protein n=1 Tax=Brassica carinata TaxID=52824 RepID=A0A8X7VYR0_BRACI|nr:hypothetical protein Bca52824_013781 [Brassica carinata]
MFRVSGVGIRCESDGVCRFSFRCRDLLEFSVIPVSGGPLGLPRRLFSFYSRYRRQHSLLRLSKPLLVIGRWVREVQNLLYGYAFVILFSFSASRALTSVETTSLGEIIKK